MEIFSDYKVEPSAKSGVEKRLEVVEKNLEQDNSVRGRLDVSHGQKLEFNFSSTSVPMVTDPIRFVRIHPDAKLPIKGTPGAAGYDVTSIEEVIIKPGKFQLIKTGLKGILPTGFEAQVRPRSGLALKHGITVLNSPGTIDEDYRHGWGVILYNTSSEDFKVEKGMRIAQLVFKMSLDFTLTEITDEEFAKYKTGRQGGFGSTGMK